ncbi:hypothetical protein IFM89_016575 [Coptis chinensis]|uniref:H(+)-exporting diphosphatase n=1 Tax=Coptis chinensis TaxID=261450 RepID=A0A835M072_9MAGN|nr:hypothetical protein IFM89_016575 [Coptis chinensis]
MMGSDLFGSYVEASYATLVVASISSYGINYQFTVMMYPLLISSMGTTYYMELFFNVAIGLWASLVIGFVTEYYTSNAYKFSILLNFYMLLLTLFLALH